MITKAEVYMKVIQIQKTTGQGLSGIVKVLGEDPHLWSKYLDELIEEGLVEMFDDGTTIGHTESARWYMPTKGYNLWKDGRENGSGSRFDSSRFLKHVRLYLGCLDRDSEPKHTSLDEHDDNLRKFLNPSAEFLLQNPDFMKSYAEWLERNHEALEEMKNLPMLYPGASPLESLNSGDMEWLTTRGWFEENLKVSECLNKSMGALNNDKKRESLTIQLIELMERDEKYALELEEKKLDLAEIKEEIARRERVNDVLISLNQEANIQEEITNING